VPEQTVSILQGNTFVVSDRRGDLDASPIDTHGLFSFDTRFLSRWILYINGQRPNPLSTDDVQYYAAQFFLVPGTGTVYSDSTLSIIRRRVVENGFREELTVLNHGEAPIDLDVRIEAASDFADLFEVKDQLAKKGEPYRRVDEGRLVLGYQRQNFRRETWISATGDCTIDDEGLHFHVHLPANAEWSTTLVATARVFSDIAPPAPELQRDGEDWAAGYRQDVDEWVKAAPAFSCTWEPAERIYRRSIVDLAALRFYSLSFPLGPLPAAGLPWFMTVFGRDSVITSYQVLPFAPELAATTLRNLALNQGRRINDFRDEEPGKILHELRFGEMTAFEERPHSPYYGAADATALFLVLLDEYERWTGDTQLVRDLEFEAKAALNWLDEYGDRMGAGWISYNRRNTETGLENQCWKDSWNSILFADGTLSKLPRATCELQGYAYDAKKRCSRLAREIWGDPTLSERLDQEAEAFKRRFNDEFWLADREYYALAIDGDGRKVDALTSNIGHLLWSGIADEDKAEACVRHLMSDRLFSGWGVRTMAEGDGGYNPIGYHVGTVWPHDNSIIAMGLMRYGYRAEAARIGAGIFGAATFFHDRLPEAFAGYTAHRTQFPVEYPTACSPQAWATGAPLLLLRAMLGLEPVGDRLLVDPALPLAVGRMELLDIPGRWGRTDAFGRGRIDLQLAGHAWTGGTPSMQ
jgi:glycogen debranching enzyme